MFLNKTQPHIFPSSLLMKFLFLEENSLKHVVESLHEVEQNSRTRDSSTQDKPWRSSRKPVSLRKDYSKMQRSVHEQGNRGACFADVQHFVSTGVCSSFRDDTKQLFPLLCSHTPTKHEKS